MVHLNKTKEANAVETIFCKPMDKIKKVPMTELQSKAMISILMSEKSMVEEMLQSAQSAGAWYAPVFSDRLENLGYTADVSTKLFVCLVLAKNVGQAVMWANYLAYKAKESEVTEIRFNQEVCEKWFPMGFPDQNEWIKVWDFQKVHTEGKGGSDNLLDYVSAAESIKSKVA